MKSPRVMGPFDASSRSSKQSCPTEDQSDTQKNKEWLLVSCPWPYAVPLEMGIGASQIPGGREARLASAGPRVAPPFQRLWPLLDNGGWRSNTVFFCVCARGRPCVDSVSEPFCRPASPLAVIKLSSQQGLFFLWLSFSFPFRRRCHKHRLLPPLLLACNPVPPQWACGWHEQVPGPGRCRRRFVVLRADRGLFDSHGCTGVYGYVLRCRDKETNEVVAIKKFKESEGMWRRNCSEISLFRV